MYIFSLVARYIEKADAINELGDALLDSMENFVQKTDNKVDDALVLPAIKAIRALTGIEDLEDKPKPELEVVK